MLNIYWTKINGSNGPFGGNDYVRGVIVGIASVLGDNHYPIDANDDGDHYMKMRCTEEAYQRFEKIIRKRYGALCDFNVEHES